MAVSKTADSGSIPGACAKNGLVMVMDKMDFRQILIGEAKMLSSKAWIAAAHVTAYDYLLSQGFKPVPAYKEVVFQDSSINLSEEQSAKLAEIYSMEKCLPYSSVAENAGCFTEGASVSS